jgi:hypothetical protein
MGKKYPVHRIIKSHTKNKYLELKLVFFFSSLTGSKAAERQMKDVGILSAPHAMEEKIEASMILIPSQHTQDRIRITL